MACPELVWVASGFGGAWHTAWSDAPSSPMCGAQIGATYTVLAEPGFVLYKPCAGCAERWHRIQRIVEQEVWLSARTAEAVRLTDNKGKEGGK